MLKIKQSTILFITLLVFVLFDTYLNKHTFPLTEGWWETYSWLEENSKLYVDYNLALPPLYINLISLIRSWTGENFYTIRTAFIGLKLIEMLGVYGLLKILTKDYKSCIFGLIVSETLIVIFNPVYLLKDYHTLVSILVTYAIYSNFNALLTKNYTRKIFFIISGILLSCLVLTKQNIAALTILAFIILNIHAFINKKTTLNEIIVQASSSLISLYIYSNINGWDWTKSYLSNDSKGGLVTILSRFITDTTSIKIYVTSLVISALILNYRLIDKKLKNALTTFKHEKTILLCLFLSTFVFFRELTIPLALGWPIVRFILSKSTQALFVLPFDVLIVTYALSFAGTLTAGYNFVSMQIPIAICYAEIYNYFKTSKKHFLYIFISTLIFVTSEFTMEKIFSSSYNWWGYAISPGSLSTYDTKFEQLKDIKVDKNTSLIFDAIYNTGNSLEKNQQIFAYPNIPIIYKLLDKKPPVSYPVQWFDVLPSGKAEEIIRTLNTKKPDLIYWLKPTKYVYNGHAELRKLPSGMSKIDKVLIQNINDNTYSVIFDHAFTDNFQTMDSFVNEITEPVSVSYNCSKCDLTILRKYVQEEKIIDYSFSEKYISKSNNAEFIVKENQFQIIDITFKNNIAMDYFENSIDKFDFKRSNEELFRFLILKKN